MQPSAEWYCWVFWRRWASWCGWGQWHQAGSIIHGSQNRAPGAVAVPGLRPIFRDSLGCGSFNRRWKYHPSALYDQETWPSLFQLLYCFRVICRGSLCCWLWWRRSGLSLVALQSSLSASGQKMPVLRQTLSLTANRLVWGVKPTACIYCPAAARL